MSTYLPPEVLDGLKKARKKDAKRKSRTSVEVDGRRYKVLDIWEGGFSLDAETAAHFRGLVDIFEGPNHLYQCLVFASTEENGVINFEYKRHSVASETAPLDYVRGADAPVGYLTSD